MDFDLGGADDLHVIMNLCTARELLPASDTVRRYFEAMKEAFPDLLHVSTRSGGNIVLEGGDDSGRCRWLTLEPGRICSGAVNPPSTDEAYRLHEHVLDVAPDLFQVGCPDCQALDLMYEFDFTYRGNHDEVIAEAVGGGPSLDGLLGREGARVAHYEPTVTLALDDTFRLQARMAIESRTNVLQVLTGDFDDDQFSLHFSVRQNWSEVLGRSFKDSFRRQRAIAEEMIETTIIPRLVRPLAEAVASRTRTHRGDEGGPPPTSSADAEANESEVVP